ncbi:hypothetical protein JMUB6875_48910 [Nocardia sp. JMUB6875]|uniref:DUF6188 family protein n=1 Tax=Nocardia sp. JMUB6875 TaxID=3158170 RepID=UPI0032E7A651
MNLPVNGQFAVSEPSDFALLVSTDGGFEFRIEGSMHATLGGESYDLDPGAAPWGGEPARSMRGLIESAEVDDQGALRIFFGSGDMLAVPADSDYEAWKLVGPGGYRVVSMPGGELAIWSAR